MVLERGDGFKHRIKSEAKAPEKFQVEPKEAKLQTGDKGDILLKITAVKNTPIGENKNFVKGTPENGEPTETGVKNLVIAT